ncbi:MAG: oligosaccharide flippase family protein [bacterium]|nr:oligosaccharide flippase family protein [bacterium]
MTHTVRSTLVALGLGVGAQRLLQLVTFVLIGRALGTERLGTFATGLAIASVLTVIAGAGVRNLLAREVSRAPGAARELLVRAIRTRLGLGIALAAPTGWALAEFSDRPLFFGLCLLQVIPAAFDLKHLLDATGRAPREVVIETAAAALQLGLVIAWLQGGGSQLATLALITLASRSLYAVGAMLTIARLPHSPAAPDSAPHPLARTRTGLAVSAGQTAHELMAVGDVWLVALLFGEIAAGLYAVAIRITTAALVPSAQLARLLLPHMLRANNAGDPSRTVQTALRATAFATLPVAAGGVLVAEPLVTLCGAEFALAAPALRLTLIAGVLQHFGWQLSHALFAGRRDRGYASGLLWPALLHALLLGLLAGGTAATAAGAMLAANIAYLGGGILLARGSGAPRWAPALVAPSLVAAATVAAAWLAGQVLEPPFALPLQLVAGGLACATTLWLVELRGRVLRLGDGLAAASGLVQAPARNRR